MTSVAKPASPKVEVEGAVDLLKGSKVFFILCWVSLLLSLLAMVAVLGWGFNDEDVDGAALANKKAFLAQSIVFLAAQTFASAKAWWDYHGLYVEAVAKPTTPYMVQVMVFFVIALVCAVYSIVFISISAEWRIFFALVVLWASFNAVILSIAMRDRQEAAAISQLPADHQHGRLHNILTGRYRSPKYMAMVWLLTVASLSVLLGTMWNWDQEVLPIKRKLYITGMVLWSFVSNFHLSKLIRDRIEPDKFLELQGQPFFQVLVLLSSLLSFSFLLVGACAIPLPLRERLFILAGSFFTISAAFYLAKHVGDRQYWKRTSKNLDERQL